MNMHPVLIVLATAVAVLSRNWRHNMLNAGMTGGSFSDITVWPQDIVPYKSP
jgi:hypothetical protein